jgi:alpha,alpha-trehalase
MPFDTGSPLTPAGRSWSCNGPFFLSLIVLFMTNRSLSSWLASSAVPLPASEQAAALRSPADVYGLLYERVQMQRVFGDGKAFADAVPRQSADVIMAMFHKTNPSDRDELRSFVEAHFAMPASPLAEASSHPAANGIGLLDYIAGLWPKLERHPETIAAGSSLLSLPEAYVVPGGRFREIYYWDSYFTMLGLAHDGRQDLVEAMLHNFESLIERFGHVPNGTRTYYLSRSQPPFLSLMTGLSRASGVEEKQRQLTTLVAEHSYWMTGESALGHDTPACNSVVRLPDGAVLNRYWDACDTPRDESYAEDVETAHRPGRRPADIYRDLRAGAASGWDFTSRWLDDPQDFSSIHTTDIIPADLNSLMWQLETAIASLAQALAQPELVRTYQACAESRAQAMHRHLWVAEEGRFADYDVRRGVVTPVLSAATLYPLFAGLATQAQADAVAATVKTRLLARGGLRTTTNTTDQQWDMPNGWAPLQWIAVTGLAKYGHDDLSREIARRWLMTVATAYAESGVLLEKYDIEDMKPGSGGEYPVQHGFGWTNGVTRALCALYPELTPK